MPHATVCLLSALQVHGLTTEVPHAVWIMIDTRVRTPTLDTPAAARADRISTVVRPYLEALA